MQSFAEYYGLGNLSLNNMEFQNACNSESVKAVLGALGQDWARNTITTAPIGALLRVAEGIDSVRNLALSGMNTTTEVERGSAIVCGLAQLGGLIFCVVAIIVSLALCVCAPVGSAIALWVYRKLTLTEEAMEERDRQIDELLDRKGLSLPQQKSVTPNDATTESEVQSLLP